MTIRRFLYSSYEHLVALQNVMTNSAFSTLLPDGRQRATLVITFFDAWDLVFL
jgi:hypothetical protein